MTTSNASPAITGTLAVWEDGGRGSGLNILQETKRHFTEKDAKSVCTAVSVILYVLDGAGYASR